VVALLVNRANLPIVVAFVVGLVAGAFVGSNWYEYHIISNGDDIAVLAS
jgi:hypothetical protein